MEHRDINLFTLCSVNQFLLTMLYLVLITVLRQAIVKSRWTPDKTAQDHSRQ